MEDINQQLHEVVLRGKIKHVKENLKKGFDINQTDQDKYTLRVTALYNRNTVTKLFISLEAEVNTGDIRGSTALHSAALNGHLDVTKYLISQGSKVNKEDTDGLTALHCAASNGHLDVTEYLISQLAEVNKGDNRGWTALHRATGNGHLDVTEYLITQGAQVNKGCNDCWTPLHNAVQNGHLDITKYLISQGSEVNMGNKEGWTALHCAASNGHLDVTEYLISQLAEVKRGDNRGWTALHSATVNGHLDVIKYLISQGGEVNKGNKDDLTALHIAAFKGHLDFTEYLITQKAQVNKGSNYGWTPLHLAVQNGHLDVIKYLISQGAKVNQGNNEGGTALHGAAFNGNLDLTEYLITQGAQVNKGCNDGWTPLHLAVQNGHLDVIKYLISQGAKVNQGNNDGRTALHSAAFYGHLDVTAYLITQGAEVNTGCNDDWTPLHRAVQNGNLDVIKYLISEGAEVNKGTTRGPGALGVAAQIGHLEVTKYLIGQGAEMNQGDNHGRTALCFAAFNGHLDVTKYLISQGVEVNKGEGELTALHRAVLNGHLDVTKYLISHGAEVNKGNNDGTTALQCAAQGGHLDVTEYLISHGAEVNKGNNRGGTALHIAAQEGHLDVTEYLISQGAEVNKGDNDVWTAFHIAAGNGHLDVTKHLISKGAEIDKGNNDGRTALHSAAQEGHLDVTEYLISQLAKVNKGDNRGGTALHIATENGHLDVIKYLISEGAEINKGENSGWNALHLAVSNGHLDVTRYLITQGAQVNNGSNVGWTPLHHAVQNGNLDVVKVLLAGGARSDTGDIKGDTPLKLSLDLGYQSIVDLFIDRSMYKLKQNDLTGIHLAIQDGHTSTIEKLVSGGADLNVQSSDGQTCLHRAIKLCYMSGRTMHDTDTLKEISDEYYEGELSPEKALVFYLLEKRAKLDVRDQTGNLPIQYAKDEVVKQMILSRLPFLEKIQSYRDEPSTPAIVSVEVRRNTSQEIELEDHGVSMLIPPEAVHQNDPCKITLTLLQNTPSFDIKDDESVVCYGIRCDPPNMIFHQPVKIRIPHFALVVNPDQVKPNIVSRVLYPGTDVTITSRKRSSSSSDEPPYCRVYKRHLELYIGKCADWWVLIPLEQQMIQHQLICTPYIPDKIERGQEFEVHLQMHADLPGMETDIRKEKKQQSYHKSHRSVPFSVESKSGDITVTCHREGDQIDSKVLSLQDVCGKMRHNILLSVTPTDEVFTGITIAFTQAGRLGVSRSIAFIIRHTDGQEYLSPSEPLSFVGAVEEVLKSDLPDIDVVTIAQTMTVEQFYDLGVALGFTIQRLDVIEYRRFHDREQAIYDMLVTWRERQPSDKAAKETFLSLMESLDPPAEGIAISGGLSNAIPRRAISEPYSEITEQPKQRDHRFRYPVEGRQAGSIAGEKSTSDLPSYPSIKVSNLNGRAKVVVSLVTKNDPPLPHPHRLVGDGCRDGVCTRMIDPQRPEVVFHKIGVQRTMKKEVENSLEERKRAGVKLSMVVNKGKTGKKHNYEMKAVRLFFEVYIETIASSGVFDKYLTPVISTAVYDKNIGLTGEIPDRTLLAFARQIRPQRFYEIGEKLGFNTSELQHIEHRILYNRKNANIQMLSSWKASQTSRRKATQTLKLVWESVQDVSKAEKTEGLDFIEAAHAQGPSGGKTMTQEPTSTIDQPLLDDKSSKNQVGKRIHWDFLTDSPQELTLQDNEVVISCGIRFSPSGVKLSESIKVTLDHNAYFTNPRRAEIVFYTRNKDSTSFVRIPASISCCPRCDVRSKDLDLYVDHFSDWWIVAVFTRYFIGKRVRCTPYVRPPVTKGLTHLLLLCIYDDLLDVIMKINEEMKEYRKLYPPQPMFVQWRYGDINIELFDGSKESKENIDKQILGERDMYLFESKQFSFEVKPLESGTSQRFLEFTLDQRKSSSYPTLIRFDLKYDGAAFSTMDAGSQSAEVSTLSGPSDEQKVTDADILNLAKLLPPDRWSHLYVALRIDYSTAEGIRKEFTEKTEQYIHLLQNWKAASSRTRKDLNAILVKVESGGLVDTYVD